MRRYCLVLSTILLLLFGVSCSGLQITPIPTIFPSEYIPTVIEMTVLAGQINSPTQTISPTQNISSASSTPLPKVGTSVAQDSSTPLAFSQTSTASPMPSATSTIDLNTTPTRHPTRTPTVTATPTLPAAGVQIAMPGPMSRVASPLHMTANLRSAPSGSYHVELWIEPLQEGGEPRLIYREVKRLISNPVDWVYLDKLIQFEINRVSEFGQLRVSMFDQYDRPVSINSVDLILLSMGTSSVTPMGGKTEPIVIREPTPNHLIQGGTVIVSGLVKPTEEFMLVELVAADGAVVGYGQVFVTPSADGSYVPYTAEVPYQVETATWVRLSVSESNNRIPGMENLSSVQVLLSP